MADTNVTDERVLNLRAWSTACLGTVNEIIITSIMELLIKNRYNVRCDQFRDQNLQDDLTGRAHNAPTQVKHAAVAKLTKAGHARSNETVKNGDERDERALSSGHFSSIHLLAKRRRR